MATPEALYTGNGATTTYAYAFDTLDQAHVKASLDGVDTAAFTIPVAGQVQFDAAPGNGVAIRIYRLTPDTSINATFTPGSALRSQDLNSNFEQLLFVTQEDRVTSNNSDAKADLAIATAEGAVVTADAAVVTADAAVVTADAADAKADTAIADSAAAVVTAGSAEATAISAAADADAAVIDAAAAVVDAAAAVITANDAESIANSALDIVAGTVQYVPIADVASIPGTPDDGDAIQIVDSTGIESFTPLAGLPGGFTGSAQLFIRLQYTTSGTTWNYIGYGANDPDNRYVIQGELGTAALPAYYFDANTGIYSPGADQVAISTNGTGRLFIDSTGNVGLGTSTPSEKLEVSGGIRATGEASWGSGSEGAFIDYYAAGSMVRIGHLNGASGSAKNINFYSGGSNVLAITSAGRVGIGTSSPQGALHINGTGGTANTSAQLRISLDGTTEGFFGIAPVADSIITGSAQGDTAIRNDGGRILFSTNSGTTAHAVIDSSGRVGIGVTPSQALHVVGTADRTPVAFKGSGTGTGYLYADNTSFGVSTNSGNLGASSAFVGVDSANHVLFITSGSERGRWDSSGRFLVGTSSASDASKFVVQGQVGANAGMMSVRRNAVGAEAQRLGQINFDDSSANIGASIEAIGDAAWGTNDYPTRLSFSTCPDGSAAPVERLRITSGGEILAGKTTVTVNSDGAPFYAGFGSFTRTGNTVQIINRLTDDGKLIEFWQDGNPEGNISVSGNTVAYNTSSDYRLKENVVPLTGAVDRLKQLPVRRFNFIANPDKTVDGFIAHEAQAVVPEAVHGTKDEVDADGNPVYQGIDQSKLVPLLTAALQEALAEIESLKARVTALEP